MDGNAKGSQPGFLMTMNGLVVKEYYQIIVDSYIEKLEEFQARVVTVLQDA